MGEEPKGFDGFRSMVSDLTKFDSELESLPLKALPDTPPKVRSKDSNVDSSIKEPLKAPAPTIASNEKAKEASDQNGEKPKSISYGAESPGAGSQELQGQGSESQRPDRPDISIARSQPISEASASISPQGRPASGVAAPQRAPGVRPEDASRAQAQTQPPRAPGVRPEDASRAQAKTQPPRAPGVRPEDASRAQAKTQTQTQVKAQPPRGRGFFFWAFLAINIILLGVIVALIFYIFAIKEEYSYLAERYKYRNYANLIDTNEISWCLTNNLYYNVLSSFITTYDSQSLGIIKSIYPTNCKFKICTANDMRLASSSEYFNRITVISMAIDEINLINPLLIMQLNDIYPELVENFVVADSAEVMEAQRTLQELGYYQGDINGYVDFESFKGAIRKFQGDLHLPQNGKLTRELLKLIKAINSVSFSCVKN